MERTNPFTIRLIRAFEGPRHDRLRRIWETVAEYVAPQNVNVRWFANPGARLRHAECFNHMWQEEREFDNRLVLFTEEDFLPDLENDDWYGLRHFEPGTGLIACTYCTRDPKSRKMKPHRNKVGGWYLLMDKAYVPEEINFEGDPDPANQLAHHLSAYNIDTLLVTGADAYPLHYGVEYPYGTHLFWSRHYNDKPSTRISGFRLGDIQRKVDNRISRWIREQPEDFQNLLIERQGRSILGSCSELAEDSGGCPRSSSSLSKSQRPHRLRLR